MTTYSGTYDLGAYAGRVFIGPDLNAYVIPVPGADLGATVTGTPAANLSAFVRSLHISDLGAYLTTFYEANLGAGVHGWEYTDLGTTVAWHDPAALSGTVNIIQPAVLSGTVQVYHISDLSSEMHGWDTKDLGVTIGWHDPADLTAYAGVVFPADLSASVRSLHMYFLPATVSGTYAHETEYDPASGYYIRDLVCVTVAGGGYSDLGVVYNIDYKTSDLPARIRITGEALLNASVTVWPLERTGDLGASVSTYDTGDITATITGTGDYIDLGGYANPTGYTADLRAIVYSNLSYITTIFPVSTLMTYDLTATVGILSCEGGSSYSDLEAIYTRNFVSDLGAELFVIRDPQHTVSGTHPDYDIRPDLLAEINTSSIVLDVIELIIEPFFVTYRVGAKAVDAVGIRVIPDRYLDLSAEVGIARPHADLPAQVVVRRPAIWREDRLTYDSTVTPPVATTSTGFTTDIEYVNIRNPKIKRTVRFKFSGGDREFYYRSISNTVSKYSDNLWKIKAISFDTVDEFEDTRYYRERILKEIDKYPDIDTAIRDLIVDVVGQGRDNLAATITATGGYKDLNVTVISTRLDETSDLNAAVYIVGNEPVLSGTVTVIP